MQAWPAAIARVNPERNTPCHTLAFPDGERLGYYVQARTGSWMIGRINGRAVARDYDAWPCGWQSLPGARFLSAGLLTPEGQCELRRDSRHDR